MKAILGKKVGMTQVFTELGDVVPVTVIESGDIVVVQKKTVEKDGYDAIQVGFGDVKLALGLGLMLGTSRGFATLMLAFFIGAVVGIFLLIGKLRISLPSWAINNS